jgi:hypothetical protein
VLPALFVWLLVGGVKDCTLFAIGWSDPLYPLAWACSSLVMMVLAAAMVLQAHIICARFSSRPGRTPQLALLVCAAIAAGLVLTWILNDGLTVRRFVNHVFVADQITSLTYASFLILSGIFYRGAAVPVSRVIKAHRMNAASYFAATGVAYYVIHYSDGKSINEVTVLMNMAYVVLMLRWAGLGPISEVELPDATEEQRRYIRQQIKRRVNRPWGGSGLHPLESTSDALSAERIVRQFRAS